LNLLRVGAFLVGVTIGLPAATLGGGLFGTGAAETPWDEVMPHRHYFQSEDGVKTYIGPNFCTNTATVEGFAGFHTMVHMTDPGLTNVMSERCVIE
jgi:hypothetical protein